VFYFPFPSFFFLVKKTLPMNRRKLKQSGKMLWHCYAGVPLIALAGRYDEKKFITAKNWALYQPANRLYQQLDINY